MIAKYRYSLILLKELIITDFKLRYQGSVLGYLWSLIRPLALFAILYVVFVKFLRIGGNVPHFPISLLLGIVIWGYFTEVTTNGMQSIVARGDLLRKINFPKYIVVLSTAFSALINLIINLVVVFIFMYFSDVDFRWVGLIFPLLILELFVFSIAISFFLSALFVRYRDFSHIWEVVLQGAFYATPILYPLSIVPGIGAKLLILNPVAQIIQDSRYVLITNATQLGENLYGSTLYRAIPFGIVTIAILMSISYFRSRQKLFAEEV